MYNSVMSRSPTEAEPNLHFRNHFQLHVIESGGAAAADGLSACAPGDSASPQPARGMNRVMDMERTITPTCWAQRAALGWKVAAAPTIARARCTCCATSRAPRLARICPRRSGSSQVLQPRVRACRRLLPARASCPSTRAEVRHQPVGR